MALLAFPKHDFVCHVFFSSFLLLHHLLSSATSIAFTSDFFAHTLLALVAQSPFTSASIAASHLSRFELTDCHSPRCRLFDFLSSVLLFCCAIIYPLTFAQTGLLTFPFHSFQS
ncbi:hypothetical protein CBOM_08040 [Ceraceosorus bombacis]|uniref:Uncharacterized protein n=1 Tax=Ceraceosorus bombacis TaxID=401625 RepID=A0A0P1BL79_9BASI|nr:hypothetical protein CBOM_08040 [Ceraceosorus bombacis]